MILQNRLKRLGNSIGVVILGGALSEKNSVEFVK